MTTPNPNPYAPPSERTSSGPPRRRFSTDDVERSRRTRVPTIFGYMNLAVALLTLISALVMVIADKSGAVPEAAGELTTLAGTMSALALLLLVTAYGLIKRLRWASAMAKIWFIFTMSTLALTGGLGLSRGKGMLFAGAFAVAIYACVYGVIMVVAVSKRYVRASLDK
jgi:hypothetical protein